MSELLGPRKAPTALQIVALQRRLLGWYRRSRRDLPWRRTRDPYCIWVSEVMLQQTQVATAIPFYQNFFARFPSLEDLARAKRDEVLAAWAGLGYYRRARHLHEAAIAVVREHDGRVPDDPVAFALMPGVGRYTTGAVLSIAFDRPLPVLDGNVARVLSRLFTMRASVRDPRGSRRLWKLAAQLVPRRGAGDWNQALMELGATICTPSAPRCNQCPVASLCRAHAMGRTGEFPPVAARRAIEYQRRAVALIGRRGRVLMTRREGALLAGLWEPPGVELRDGDSARASLRAALKRLGVRAQLEPTGEIVRHGITHRDIRVEVWRGEMQGAAPRSVRLRWIKPGKPPVALTALAKKVARRLTRGSASLRA